MKPSERIVEIIRPLETIPVYRLHLPKYNEAAWEIEGKHLYPEYADYEEYRKAKEKRG